MALGVRWCRTEAAVLQHRLRTFVLAGRARAYVIGIGSIAAGWTFNTAFVLENTDGWLSNPLWGAGSWAQYMQLLFDNPASGSAAIDFTIAHVLLLPLVAIVGGRRLGINSRGCSS